jgi:hypothetical protein
MIVKLPPFVLNKLMNPKPVLYLEQYQDWLTQNAGDIVDVSMIPSHEGIKFKLAQL